jgi:hypothetical protein
MESWDAVGCCGVSQPRGTGTAVALKYKKRKCQLLSAVCAAVAARANKRARFQKQCLQRAAFSWVEVEDGLS